MNCWVCGVEEAQETEVVCTPCDKELQGTQAACNELIHRKVAQLNTTRPLHQQIVLEGK